MAGAFYGEVLAGATLGAALTAGRQAVAATRSLDWADYVHYGQHDFVLKLKQRGG
jgi:hypothetical protein